MKNKSASSTALSVSCTILFVLFVVGGNFFFYADCFFILSCSIKISEIVTRLVINAWAKDSNGIYLIQDFFYIKIF